jgi:uncharacterized repeat protein (TIGR03803 family)
VAPLIFDSSGNLYGTTGWGGALGYGVIFKLQPNPDGTWTESVLHAFKGKPAKTPEAGLVFDTAGNLYGTTYLSAHGAGTVFKLTPNPDGRWTSSVLHVFGGDRDGGNPMADLVFDPAGNLYGTTLQGGRTGCYQTGCGTVFKLAPGPTGWTFSVLYRFKPGKEGVNPRDGVTLDNAGNLFGTTWLDSGGMGHGSVYKLAPNQDGSWTETVLHRFKGGASGGGADSNLILDAAGNLYGTAAGYHNGDCHDIDGCGLVFQITP